MKCFLIIAVIGWTLSANAAICYVSTTGNDATAIRGNPIFPSLTLTNAFALSLAGDTISLGSGTFHNGTNIIEVIDRNISGAGKTSTFIDGGISGGRIFFLSGSTAMSDFTLTVTNTLGPIVYPIDSDINAGPATISMSRVAVNGYSDGINILGASPITFTADNCNFTSFYDAVILWSSNPASTFALTSCTASVSKHASLYGVEMRAVVLGGGSSTTTITGCSISASNATTTTKAIYNTSQNLILNCNTLLASSSFGTVYRLEQTAGATIVSTNFSMSQVLISGGTLTAGTVPCTGTYYVDWAGGSDANSGRSTTFPWKRCPGMTGFAGAYAHAPGDQFIFKGGVTWPVAAFPMTISNGGSSDTVRDYYGVDATWFSGGSFSFPVFDFENTIIGPGFTGSSGVLVNNANYITIELNMKRHRAPLQYGATSLGFAGSTSFITVTNSDIGDWSVTGTGAGSDAGGGIQNYGTGTGFIVTNCELHQSNEANKCGYATKNISTVAYSSFHDTPNCIFGSSLVHHNHVFDVPNCTDPTSHPNAIASTGPSTVFANLVHDLASGVSAIFSTPDWSGGTSIDLIYNNVVFNVGLQAPIQLDTSGANTATIGIRAYNNTLMGNSGSGYCIRVVARGTTPYGLLDCKNNHLITSGTAIAYNNVGAGNGNVTTVDLLTNLQMDVATATINGYVEGNLYQPTLTNSPTVRVGTDLRSYFTVDRLGTNRPISLWDIGAYQQAGGVLPPPPLPPPGKVKLRVTHVKTNHAKAK